MMEMTLRMIGEPIAKGRLHALRIILLTKLIVWAWRRLAKECGVPLERVANEMEISPKRS